jgi:transaldolase
MPAVLAIFSPVQAIIAADAGENAKADNRVAMSSLFIGNLART